MRLFQIDNFEPVPTEEFFMIEEFKALYALKYNEATGDKQGRNRLKGLAEARFIYFLCDHKSEFAKYSAEERKAEALSAAGLDPEYKLSETLEAAIKRYEKLTESRNLRLLKSANTAVDKLSDYLQSVDFNQRTATGQMVFDPKDLISNVGNLGKVIEGLDKLEEAVMKDEGSEASTRGAAEKGRLE